MGKGSGKVNLDLILRIVELVILVAALVCFLHQSGALFKDLLVNYYHMSTEADDALNISASIYIVILGVMILQKFFGMELDQQFQGVFSAVGTVLLLGSGIAVCCMHGNEGWSRAVSTGFIGICAGVTLCCGALKDFGVLK